MGLHWQELVIVLVIALVIFGPKRVPEIMGSMGRGVREFKDSLTGSGSSADGAGTGSEAREVKMLAAGQSSPADGGAGPVAAPAEAERH